MRVAVYYNNNDVCVEEMPVPEIGPGEILIRVEASGICGSDVAEWDRLPKAPLVLGHEIAGVVADVGDGVEKFKEGDRVTAAHHVPCNTCHYCLGGHHTVCDTLRHTKFDPGGFAEFIRLPAINVDRGVFKLPEEVSFEEASFTEPLACVLRGQRATGIVPGQCVLVIGSGIAGLIHIHLASVMGTSRVIAVDVLDSRLEAAGRFGAYTAIHADEDIPSHVRRLNDGRLADVVIVCTTAPSAFERALESVERGGTVLFFAPPEPDFILQVPVNKLFYRNDITLTTSYAGSPSDYATALELIRTRKLCLNRMITHRLPMVEVGEGFRLVAAGRDCIKVIIEPQR
ncbi:MAG: zinc-dependent dehydrogenase [Chloroflexota bacterium]|nr:zinc-dependent dehydrogenase [Chloroflexota bacterium]